jgi:pyroglutamyl-peptidase
VIEVVRSVLANLLLVTAVAACADVVDPVDPVDDPNEGLLRDFIDGKYDAAGHPLNAKVVEVERVLRDDASCGTRRDGVLELRAACEIALPMGADQGGLLVNARLRVRQAPTWGRIVTLTALGPNGDELGKQTLTVSRLRGRDRWIDLPIALQASAGMAHLRLEVAPGATVDLQYVEVFPKELGVIVSPGAGVYTDEAKITFELPKGKKIERLEANGVDMRPVLDQLLTDRKATKTVTEFRTLIEVAVGDLLPERDDVVDLRVHSSGDTSRTQIRKTPAPCNFEGDPDGKKVLVTGFQPFPADGWHENVSAVAISGLDPSQLRGAQVMRLVLPVEYDRAASLVSDIIERCEPNHVISFGQGGGSIALEEMSYNLQDTGELAGGAPDNRGIIRAANPIVVDGPQERESLLPLDAIEDAMLAIGETPRRSIDPGRYICNNVMYNNIEKMALRGRAGFIHLPYTTWFDDGAREKWGKVVLAAVQATVDAN